MQLLHAIGELIEALQSTGSQLCKALLMQITQRIDLKEDQLTARVDIVHQLHHRLNSTEIELSPFEISTPIRLARRGGELKLIIKGAALERTPKTRK